MKVILLQEVQKLGKAGDVKAVSGGYAINFLIPKKLARPATLSALKEQSRKQSETAARKTKEYAKYQALAEKLKKLELLVTLTVGDKGRAFGSVTTQDIAEELAKQGIAVKKQWIELEQPIKTTGEHAVRVKFPHRIEAEAKIIIAAANTV